jgi:hypothetical protein
MKLKEILLGIAIAIIFLMFCVFGTKLIYDSPKYESYCNYSEINPTVYDKANVNESEFLIEEKIREEKYKECSEKYELANKNYSKNMFVISLIFGILVIIICVIFIEINSISGGLMLGSLMFLIYGTGRYWNYMDDLMRFLILAVALGVLIYVAYWINKRKTKLKKVKNSKK